MIALPESLELLRSRLQDALEQGDWEAVGVLHPECAALIERLNEAQAWDDQRLRKQINMLAALYDKLQQAAIAERGRIAEELKRLNQSKHLG